MPTPNERFDISLTEMLEEAASFDLSSEHATSAMKNLKLFTECRPPAPESEPTPKPVPTTVWEKVKAGVADVWDNETTRVVIKAGGAFAGVALVAYTTIRKDHVMERQAIAQANQRTT